jgi:hypothetical protein
MKLRIACGSYVDYRTPRGGGLLRSEPHYAQFESLQLLCDDGYWRDIPEIWIGSFDGPRPSELKCHFLDDA